MVVKNKALRGSLVGRGFYVFNNKPHFDKLGNKHMYKVDLALTDEDGNPLIITNKKTGEKVNMLERAKEYGVTLREPYGNVNGIHIRAKRDVKEKAKYPDGTTGPTLPPITKAKDGSEFKEPIGDESLIQVDFSMYPIEVGKNKGKMSAYLNAITVLKHVPYISKMQEDFEFDVDASAPAKKSSPSVSKKESSPVEEYDDELLDE